MAIVATRVDRPIAFVHALDPDVVPHDKTKKARAWIPKARATVNPGATVVHIAPLSNPDLIECYALGRGKAPWEIACRSVQKVDGKPVDYDGADAWLRTIHWSQAYSLYTTVELLTAGWDPEAPPEPPADKGDGDDVPFDGPATDGA